MKNIQVVPETNLDLPRDTMLTMYADLPIGDDPVALGWIARNGGLVVRHGIGENAYAAFLKGGKLSAPIPRNGFVNESKVKVFWSFIVEGFEHINPKVDKAYTDAGKYSFEVMNKAADESIVRMKATGVTMVDIDRAPFVSIMADWYKAKDAAGELPEGFLATVAATIEDVCS